MNASEIHCWGSLLLRFRMMLTRQNHYLPSKIIATTTSNHHHHHQLVSVIHVPMVLLSSLGQNGSFWLLLLPASCHTSESTATANGQTVGVWRSGELLWPHAHHRHEEPHRLRQALQTPISEVNEGKDSVAQTSSAKRR